VLLDACLGRSHRSADGRAKLRLALERSRSLLGLPDNYLIGLVPGSDTGAVEMALWSMLGARGVDVFAWENFGLDWVKDIFTELRLTDVRRFEAPYGQLPDLAQADFGRDVVFTWNGTTSGVKVPNGDWIASERAGLTICDATSAVFAMELPWEKLDVVTYSWQKVLGGEAAHGMLILSPRAVTRLERYQPSWPIPKLFRLTKNGRLDHEIFTGATINTPSMLCVEDYLNCLRWAESIGGLRGLIQRSQANLAVIEDWVARTQWVDFLAEDAATRSNSSICLTVTAEDVVKCSEDDQRAMSTALATRLEIEGVAYDINAYRTAPPGLRIWAGATVETSDLKLLLPWLDWSFEQRHQ
jgi:phosphoserine aminotransferase